MSDDDKKLMREFEEFVKAEDRKELTLQDLGPDDFECNCEMCMMGLDIIPAKKA